MINTSNSFTFAYKTKLNTMDNFIKEMSEIEQLPKKDYERPMPPDYTPEPKRNEPIPAPEKEEQL